MTSSLTTNLNDFNSQIASIANTLTTNTSKVIALDMNTNFNESYLADDVHYNEAGAKFIADIYFDGIQSFLSFITNVILRGLPRLLPKFILKIIYKYFLRN